MRQFTAKENKLNIIFSSFLIIGYIICAYFFSTMAKQVVGALGVLLQVLILLIFGLLLFYATRVGEGRQIKRFSLAVLLLVDIPSLYIIAAAFIPNLPFSAAINPALAQQAQETAQAAPDGLSVILILACVALGYGLPYTFFSGYELRDESTESASVVAGGIAEELADTRSEEEAAEDNAEELTIAADAQEAAEDAETVIAEEAEKADDAAEAGETEEKKEEE